MVGAGSASTSPITIVGTPVKASSANGTDVTSPSYDITGATRLFVFGANLNSSACSITDNLSPTHNTYTQLNALPGQQTPTGFYVLNPITSTTFTVKLTCADPSVIVIAATGGPTPTFDKQGTVNSESGGTSLQMPTASQTPAINGEICLFYMYMNGASWSAFSINQGFTAIQGTPVAGKAFGGIAGYLIQTSAAALQPTASWTTAQSAYGGLACLQ